MMGLLNWDMIGISLEYNISIYIYIYTMDWFKGKITGKLYILF